MKYEEVMRVVRTIRVYPLEVTETVHKRKYKNKVYKWVVRRVTIPSGVESKKVYVIPEPDFNRLIDLLNRIVEYLAEEEERGSASS